MKKQVIITLLFIILLAGIVYCASPAITHYGLQIFTDGIQIGTDPNNAWTSAGNITAKNIYSNGALTATLDANSHVADLAVYDKHTNLTSTSLDLGNASIDPNGDITAKSGTFTKDGIATTSTAGLTLQNTTASTSGVPVQYSPSLSVIGTMWDTDGSSDIGEWQVRQTGSSSGTTGNYLYFGHRKNSDPLSFQIYFDNAGQIGCPSINATGSITNRRTLTTASGDGIICLNSNTATAGVPVNMSPRFRLNSKVWNTTGAGSSETSDWIMENLPISGTTPSSLLKFGYSANGGAYSYPFTIDNSGQISSGADTDTTFIFGRAKIWGSSDIAYFSHYDNTSAGNYSLKQTANGATQINSSAVAGNIYFSINNAAIASITTLDIRPTTDNSIYLGKNDDDSPMSFKGVILKDTTNGKYYRIEVINGVITATDLTD